jgi:hypothetical protein
MNRLNDLSEILTILSAMIAPVVLISACASVALSTSNRMARIIDRTRKLLERFEGMARATTIDDSADEESMMLYDELLLSTQRSRLLQRALASLYVAMSTFIATSVVLGFVAILNEGYSWVPLALMMIGAGLLFYTSVLLIREIYLTRRAIDIEMDFVLSRTQRHASPALRAYQRQKPDLLSETKPTV